MDLLAKRGALQQEHAAARVTAAGAEETATLSQNEITALLEKLTEDRERKDGLSREIGDRRARVCT